LRILGLGRVGGTLAPKAQAFGIRVCAYDPYLDDDIFGMMGESELKLMKPSAVIVNTARGAIAGAARDVLASEAPYRGQS
jgi:D-3-phosphoglycerate dehydrogenase